MPTAYFFGAGASKADHFPLTRELLCALAAWLEPQRRTVGQGSELWAFLESAFGVTLEELRAAAAQWKAHCQSVTGRTSGTVPPPPVRLPHLTDILSILDILLADEGGFGLETRTGRALKGSSLRKAREQVATAIAVGFNQLDQHLRERRGTPLLVERFVTPSIIGAGDVLITTNWDILLDRARDRAFGSTPGDYGTDSMLLGTVPEPGERRLRRPKLYKLHGSLNWLHCPRCSALRIDVATVTAHDGYLPGTRNKRSRCASCHMPCEAVLVTPTFVKAYRNRHLLNIWAGAQQALAEAGRWVFIGYSLPDDDIHIKGLLLKAKRMRLDLAARAPEIQVVTHAPDASLRERYQRLFGEAVRFDPAKGGFAAYVEECTRAASKEAARRAHRQMLKDREAARRAAKRRRNKRQTR